MPAPLDIVAELVVEVHAHRRMLARDYALIHSHRYRAAAPADVGHASLTGR